MPVVVDTNAIVHAARQLQFTCYGVSRDSGWHTNIATGQPYTHEERDQLFPVKIALAHSELSEALEGHRKSLMDDHLPTRPMAECEIADAIIRLFDLAGMMGYDVPGAINDKLVYNQQRADHTVAHRLQAGGKKY